MDQYIAHAGQQAGALRQPGAGRLPLLHAEGDRGERHGLPAQPEPRRPGEERAVQQPRVPPGAVDRRRPAGADRRGLRRPGRAGAAVDRRRATRSTTSGWPSSTPSTTPTPPTRSSTRCCRTRTARATGSTAQGRRLSIIFELDQTRTTFLDMFQLVIPMFQAVGIDAQIRTMDRSLWETRVRDGREFDATAHQFGANSGIAAMLDARYFVPFSANSLYAPGWSLYFTDAGQPERDRAAGRRQGAAGALQAAARHRRSGEAEGDHGADPRERRRPVPGLRREPAAGRLRRGQERHGQHDAGDAELVRLADPGPVASRAVLQGRS